MEVEDFIDSLSSLEKQLNRRRAMYVETNEEKNVVRAVVATWFQTFRPLFVELLRKEEHLSLIDSCLQNLLRLATENSSRYEYRSILRKTKKLFKDNLLIPLTKAYWERPPSTSYSDFNELVAIRLEAMDPFLRDSYEQVIADVSSDDRKSYKGTANELRELLREVLHRLAPDQAVRKQKWFKTVHPEDTDKIRPTQAERTKYILRLRGSGDSVIDAVKDYIEAAEDRLGRVVRSTYDRANASTHTYRAKQEVQTQLRYLNALFLELLPETAKITKTP